MPSQDEAAVLDPIDDDISLRGAIPAASKRYMLDARHVGTWSSFAAMRSLFSSSATLDAEMRHRPISRMPKP